MKLLAIEDERELLYSIKTYFQSDGNIVEGAADYIEASEKINIYQYDCILLDLNLPGGSGFDLIPQIKRMKGDTGIIIISAREGLDDRIKGLEYGADDYIVKPFHLSELNARINSVIRRLKFKGDDKITFNEIEIDTNEHKVKVHDKTVELTKKEYDILLFFVTNKNRVLTKESIGEHIWGDYMDSSPSFDFVYTHIKNLRKKLIEHKCTDYIKNIYGVGYKFIDE
jgi:DNA-binding response OmpR family regulator